MALHSLLMLPVPIKAWLHALAMLVPTCQGRGLAAGASIITRCTLLNVSTANRRAGERSLLGPAPLNYRRPMYRARTPPPALVPSRLLLQPRGCVLALRAPDQCTPSPCRSFSRAQPIPIPFVHTHTYIIIQTLLHHRPATRAPAPARPSCQRVELNARSTHLRLRVLACAAFIPTGCCPAFWWNTRSV
jgi:hypothetical protein